MARVCFVNTLFFMCGRSSLHDAPVSVLERFELPPVLPDFAPRYNIAPSQAQWTILLDENHRPAVRSLLWGLVPSWASDPSIGSRMINARAESLAEKRSWEKPLRYRRCLVLADGYYEWSGMGKARTPWFFHLSDHRPFALAGLWERWHRGATTMETCVIITTQAGSRAAAVHHRMPVVLTSEGMRAWVDPETGVSKALDLLVPYEESDLECYEVSRYVNSPANDSPDCIAAA